MAGRMAKRERKEGHLRSRRREDNERWRKFGKGKELNGEGNRHSLETSTASVLKSVVSKNDHPLR